VLAKVAKATWEIASAVILLFTVAAFGVADQVAPWPTYRFLARFEPQMDRFIGFLLRE
jgi:hypothetical protein